MGKTELCYSASNTGTVNRSVVSHSQSHFRSPENEAMTHIQLETGKTRPQMSHLLLACVYLCMQLTLPESPLIHKI